MIKLLDIKLKANWSIILRPTTKYVKLVDLRIRIEKKNIVLKHFIGHREARGQGGSCMNRQLRLGFYRRRGRTVEREGDKVRKRAAFAG